MDSLPASPSPALPAEDYEAPSVEELAAQLPQYGISAMIGKGGMGAVYLGFQSQLDRKVAIKVLRSDKVIGEAYRNHFRTEARAMAKLHHSNIIGVHDFGETESGLHYLVMEYGEGATLFDLIHDRNLDRTRILDLLEQVCSALQYAHEQGVVHRDIKPANIIVAPGGLVKVADFGLAKLRGSDGGLGDGLFGTPEYTPPEVRDPRKEVDHRADIYAVGVLLYELLVGDVPSPGLNELPSRLVDCDARFDRIVSRAMNILPSGRYQQASEIAGELGKIRANPGGKHLKVGAAAAEARRGRKVTGPRPAASCPTVPVGGPLAAKPARAGAGKAGPAVPRAGRIPAVTSGRRRMPRAAMRMRGRGDGSSAATTWLMFALFLAVVGLVFWAVSVFENRKPEGNPGNGGETTPEGQTTDPVREAEQSVR